MLVVGVEGNGEGQFEESTVGQSSLPKQIADPVVYKLVRVEGDGRLVPATDDELMEVEELLEYDKSELRFADTERGCTHNEDFCSEKARLEDLGSFQSENTEVDAEKVNARHEESVPSSSLNESCINEAQIVGECLNSLEGPMKTGLLASAVSTTLKPDFSKLKGEINLDNLSIRELHATFKATFGRETSVKDKLWLKRRIAMGLTNSCDVSTTTFIIRDNKLVKKGEEENCKIVDQPLNVDSVVGAIDDYRDSSVSYNNSTEDHQMHSAKRFRSPIIAHDHESEALHNEQRAAKRVRKPTRRYIEELSEVESGEYSGRFIPSIKNTGLGPLSSRSCVRPVQIAPSDTRAVVTRLDSLGGSGVQVPYVSRARRSRPRKNFMAFTKFHQSGMGMAAKLVKKALCVRSSRPDDEIGNRVLKATSTPRHIHQVPIGEPVINKEETGIGIISREHDMDAKCLNSSGDNSDDNVVTVPTAKGGMRRKHHRAWTIGEVMKLVEGVSRYGAGRWSEIKRLAFASYTYRTSVDLKDKWRNLLRASFAHAPAETGMNSRKHSSVPIPAPILLRVRELAELHAQAPPNFSSNKVGGSTVKSVHKKIRVPVTL
ncbi:uncharacterized protein LOC131164490 isoform X2 [Malania oleifera]|uniref:uncharacterized protein LOC131164490 isoform X2 n=1 Tax=Malania oleifera TaxID=397392 RepID=UPI0025ADABC2|nr:uncharacterized protein LOC131164490 isoform X2 [Malania oleifera]